MISGTFKVAASDDARFTAGSEYSLSIDPSVTLDVVETITAVAVPTQPSAPTGTDTSTTIPSAAGSSVAATA